MPEFKILLQTKKGISLKVKKFFTFLFILGVFQASYGQDEFDLDKEFEELGIDESLELEEIEEDNTLPSEVSEDSSVQEVRELETPTDENIKDIQVTDDAQGFDTSSGAIEQELLGLADKISVKIPDDEWSAILGDSNVTSTYTVRDGDWLFKISERLFGTGFYYPKIWALNPYITNPHEIEPGMVLVFDSGAAGPPKLSFGGNGESTDSSLNEVLGNSWSDEKLRLKSQGVLVSYASEEMKNLLKKSESSGSSEYKKYDPPSHDKKILAQLEGQYDEDGFSLEDIQGPENIKDGFSINTFVTADEVQDFGEISDAVKNGFIINNHDMVYLKFNEDKADVSEGDVFSIYEKSEGEVEHENSERTGYKYSILGHVKVVKNVGEKWQGHIFGITGVVKRNKRLTIYTPKIKKIYRNFNSQSIEAVVIGNYEGQRSLIMPGDIVYLDRGRNDGVKIGDVFGIFDNKDRRTRKVIQDKPLYIISELTVISLTGDFATALVSNSGHSFSLGKLAMTIDETTTLRDSSKSLEDVNEVEVSGDLEDIETDDLELTEDELDELDRIESQKSFIDDTEKDLNDLNDIEEDVDTMQSKLDAEDRELQGQDLNDLEGELEASDDELELIEKEKGKKYLDEDLDEKENPYGLSENDIEEIDELLEYEE